MGYLLLLINATAYTHGDKKIKIEDDFIEIALGYITLHYISCIGWS